MHKSWQCIIIDKHIYTHRPKSSSYYGWAQYMRASVVDNGSGKRANPADIRGRRRRRPLQMSLHHDGDQYLEKLLSQIRRDSVYELRKLQHHHRPVTGFDSKPALEELLEKRRQALPPIETDVAAAVSVGERQWRCRLGPRAHAFFHSPGDIGRSLQRRSEYTASTARPFHPEVPSSAAMSEMQTELRGMKSQILELKQLMRTSFELQLEIQRAIRQEVAASLLSACTSPSLSSMPPTSTVPLRSTTVVESGNCVICSEASITSVVYRCGHMCVCMQCGLELKAQGFKCPICRAPITDIIRAYSSML